MGVRVLDSAVCN